MSLRNNVEWQTSQIAYWNGVADEYDSFYKSRWSKLENLDVRSRISSLLERSQVDILDLGCGTGLGYEILKSIPLKDFSYLGIDISEAMISIASRKNPEASFKQGDMSNLNCIVGRPDLVVSLFCSFSYVENSGLVISEIHRVLKPGGICYISMLNKFSLRRLISMKFNSVEMYSTRKSSTVRGTPARVFSRTFIRSMFQDVGFKNINVFGQGFLSGAFEHQHLWKFDKIVSNLFPDFTHMITVVAQKPHLVE
jgi:ubiquinone/menaquinone biosynthesis C-methylase UbiE